MFPEEADVTTPGKKCFQHVPTKLLQNNDSTL